MTEQLALSFDSWTVQERISARARNIRIEVRGPDQVLLVIPRFCARSAARAFLNERLDWVRGKLREQAERQTVQAPLLQPLRWDDSDQLPLRGREVPLRLVPVSLARAVVRVGETITVLAAPAVLADHSRLRALLLVALKAEARRDALRLIGVEAPRLGVAMRALRIADQSSLWGSCTRAGVVSLSWRLLLAPPEVFRYVVVHELAHLVHHNHSARFWALVERQMPEYESLRIWLRSRGAALHQVLPRQ
jgi:hypothetical protein